MTNVPSVRYFRCLIMWMISMLAGAAAIALFPPQRVLLFGLVEHSLFFLMGLVSLEVFKSTVSKTRHIFFNFFVFGCAAQPIEFLCYFVPRIFSANPFAGLYGEQYLSCGIFLFCQVFCIWFCCLHLILRKISVVGLYVTTLCITGGIFILLFFPFLENPKYVYTRPDITDFRIVDRAVRVLLEGGLISPSATEVANTISLSRWQGFHRVGELTGEEKIERVEEMFPYLEGGNYETIVIKPLLEFSAYMNSSCVFILIIFFVFQYNLDPPQPAYVEKFPLALIVFSSFHVMDSFVLSRSVKLEHYIGNYNGGAILSGSALAWFILFLYLRLDFVLSSEGRFYERKIAERPREITRWRDGIDNIIIKVFFNGRLILRRLATIKDRENQPEPHDNGAEKLRKKNEKTLDN